MVFEESSREQSSIETMSRVSTNYRIFMELAPGTVFTGSSRQAPVKRPFPDDPGGNPHLAKKQKRNPERENHPIGKKSNTC